jgi:hypothetical protein
MRRAMVEWALRLAWARAWACSGVRRVRRMGAGRGKGTDEAKAQDEAKRVQLVLSSIDVAVAVGPGGVSPSKRTEPREVTGMTGMTAQLHCDCGHVGSGQVRGSASRAADKNRRWMWVRIFEGQITAINAAISNQLLRTGHVVLIGI